MLRIMSLGRHMRELQALHNSTIFDELLFNFVAAIDDYRRSLHHWPWSWIRRGQRRRAPGLYRPDSCKVDSRVGQTPRGVELRLRLESLSLLKSWTRSDVHSICSFCRFGQSSRSPFSISILLAWNRFVALHGPAFGKRIKGLQYLSTV
jgi:hypothetical protein